MAGNSRRRQAYLLLAVLLTLGAALRLTGLGFGLPAIYNPDELAIMNRAIALGQNGLNPQNFLYPSLYFYALFACEGVLFVLGWLTGRFDSLAAFEQLYFVDPSVFYLTGRLLSVACGVATIWATWRLGTRLFGPVAGLAAAALLAVAPLAVRDAHYVKHDVPVALLIVLTHLALARRPAGHFNSPPPASTFWLRSLRSSAGSWWWLASLFAGLSLSTHYYAVFVLVPVVIVVSAPLAPGEPWRHRLRRTLATLTVAAAAFIATSPFLLVEFGTTYRDVVANRAIVVDRATTSGGAFASIAFYLRWLASDAAGSVAAALAVAGFVALARAGWMRVTIALAFPVVFLLFMANTVPASRYLNPVLPFVSLLGGAAVSWVASASRTGRVVAAVALAIAVTEGAIVSAHGNAFFRQPDTRTLARDWFEQHVPSGASVLVQPYSVPLRPSREALDEALTAHLGDPARASVRFQRQRALQPYPEPAYRTIYLGSGGMDVDKIYLQPDAVDDEHGLAPIRRLGITRVIMKRYNVENPAMAALIRALERDGTLEASFSPYRPDIDAARRRDTPPFEHNTGVRIDRALERPGPIIEIWNID
ncbi:MAG: hypothetical protein ABS36_13465 [Acidobacteria bacterium SCN 69-37]|nr:MAG: hypothetical protein ABS36_13465 [Acidobacteria bacterium SCN 69-37]